MSESTPTHEVEHSARPEDTPRAVGPLFGDEPPTRGPAVLRELMRGSAVTTILAIVLALLVGGVLIASMVFFYALDGRLSVHELLIAIFLFLTAPVSAHLLVKAAMARDPSLRPEPPLTQTSKNPASASRETR